MSIQSIIDENQDSKRRTKNNDLYYRIICELCNDPDYITKELSAKATDDNIVTVDMNLCKELRKILANFLKKSTTMTESEANDAAASFKLNFDQAHVLASIIRESDYIAMKKCGKKIQYLHKPDIDVSITLETTKKSKRPNPQDRNKTVEILPHDRLVLDQHLYAFQKRIINSKK